MLLLSGCKTVTRARRSRSSRCRRARLLFTLGSTMRRRLGSSAELVYEVQIRKVRRIEYTQYTSTSFFRTALDVTTEPPLPQHSWRTALDSDGCTFAALLLNASSQNDPTLLCTRQISYRVPACCYMYCAVLDVLCSCGLSCPFCSEQSSYKV